MNKIIYKVFTTAIFLLLIIITIFPGCSKQSDNLVTTTYSSVTHGDGWLNPASTNFHGKVIATTYGWKYDKCKQCHGTDYNGGNTQSSCYPCHKYSPEYCGLCHGNSQHFYPPKSLNGNTLATQQGVGAHDVHLNSDSTVRYSAKVSCYECHIEISSFSDTNHIGSNPSVATVVFGTLAKTVTSGYTPNPVWDKNPQTCSGTYCHGYFKNGNTTATPTFTDPNSVVCGSCHGNSTTGNPTPGGHTYYPTNCSLCHSAVVDSNRVIINKYKHVNGVVDFNIKK
jgi:predicted CxxxxCH...CXXCH cytochrome family protein